MYPTLCNDSSAFSQKICDIDKHRDLPAIRVAFWRYFFGLIGSARRKKRPKSALYHHFVIRYRDRFGPERTYFAVDTFYSILSGLFAGGVGSAFCPFGLTLTYYNNNKGNTA